MRPSYGAVIIALVLLVVLSVTVVSGAEEYVFVTAWGSGGTANGQFNLSYGAALDGENNVYICDFQNNRVQKFTSSGTFLASWGSYGTANGQFRHPSGVAVDAAGTVYVADHYNHRVQKFTSSGAFLGKWGVYGSADGQMSFPYGIDVDDAGNVYVADYYNGRVQKFTSSGAFLMKFGSHGTGNGQFTYPAGVAVDHAGTIYVADQYNHRVQKFTSSGTFLAVLGGPGTADDQMRYPTNIAFDSANNAYVADHGHHRIQKFSPTGVLLTLWGTQGQANGEFWSPTGIALDSTGRVFVADTNNNRVQVFSPNRTIPTPTATATPTVTPSLTPDPGNPAPTASFEANATFGQVPLTIAFRDTSGNNPASWSWAFGDGVVSSLQHPVHVYAFPGTYTARLTATNAHGSNTTTKEIVAVSQLPYTVPIPANGTLIPCIAKIGVERGSIQRITVDGMESAMVLRKNSTGEAVNGTFIDCHLRIYTDPVGRLLGRRGWLNRSYSRLENNTQYDLYYNTDLIASYRTVEAPVLAVPGGGAAPLDGNHDGLFEDVNGNGRTDFADVVLYFNQMSWIASNEPVPAFDYNGNGRIDFADVVRLFDRL
ncbi:MAG TPA: PKD domain-containing protein [Methanoregulaceae archaeon]|nr:PKD domain-containing protein [Methanoregulaceae archaeon]